MFRLEVDVPIGSGSDWKSTFRLEVDVSIGRRRFRGLEVAVSGLEVDAPKTAQNDVIWVVGGVTNRPVNSHREGG